MNILLVDDHKVLLHSLSIFIKNELPEANIFIAESGVEAIRQVEQLNPDVVMLDVNLPFLNGIEVAQHLNKFHPQVKIIMLTSIDGEAMMVTLAQIVHGFLFKDVDSSEIIKAVKGVMGGNRYFCQESNEILMDNLDLCDETPVVKFDKRESEIVEHMASGKTSKEISDKMELKENIVNQYRDALLRKTKTKNAKALIAFAFKNGLIFKKKRRSLF